MYLAYFDESGDSGRGPKSPTKFFVLACALVAEDDWLHSLDALTEWRKRLRDNWGVPARPELKAVDFVRSRGPLRSLSLSPTERISLYRDSLEFCAGNIDMKTFAIAIDKAKIQAPHIDVRERAWTYALQRIDHFSSDEGGRVMVFPDDGHGPFIRKRIRATRRHLMFGGAYGGVLSAPLTRIVEDPNDRRSHESYLTQMADWMAYAAHRSTYVDPKSNVPDDLWDLLSPTHLTEVNKVRGGPPGIVRWP